MRGNPPHRKVFVDTHYLTARAAPGDQWHYAAGRAVRLLRGRVLYFTTFEVLTEFMSSMAQRGPWHRSAAVKRVNAILDDPVFTVIPATYELFRRGLERFDARPDKSYSLVDCISMVVMEEEGITEILSNDHHFAQEGFTCLIQRA